MANDDVQFPPDESGPPPASPDEVPGFGTTPEELEVLLRHNETVALDMKMFGFFGGAWGSTESGILYHASGRAGRAAAALGPAAARAVREALVRERRADLGDEAWRVYVEGAPEEQDRLVSQAQDGIAHFQQKLADGAEREQAAAYLRAHPDRVYVDADGDLWHWADRLGRDPADVQPDLVLAIRTKGGMSYDRHVRMARPADWRPRYGLR